MSTKRSYGEACRFAHALDLVGERWALLVVRELLLGPKRYTDIRNGLPSARKLPPPAGVSVYELTEWGEELEPIVTRLGAWGARSPFPPDAEEIGTDSIVLALRSLFDPEAAGRMVATYELRLGEDVFHVDIGDWEIELHRGAAEDAAPGTICKAERARTQRKRRRLRPPGPVRSPQLDR